LLRVDLYTTCVGRVLAQVDIRGSGQVESIGGGDGAIGRNVLRCNDCIVRGADPGKAQCAGAGNFHVTELRGDGRIEVHADTGVIGDHADTITVDAAERGGADGKLIGRIGSGIVGGDGKIAVGHLLVAGQKIEFAAADICVQPDSTGEHIKTRCVLHVGTGTVEADRAAAHVEAGQRAAGQQWRAGGQGAADRVDKAAAATGNAVGVGNDQVGLAAADFNRPEQ